MAQAAEAPQKLPNSAPNSPAGSGPSLFGFLPNSIPALDALPSPTARRLAIGCYILPQSLAVRADAFLEVAQNAFQLAQEL